jgi:hypothetical protein
MMSCRHGRADLSLRSPVGFYNRPSVPHGFSWTMHRFSSVIFGYHYCMVVAANIDDRLQFTTLPPGAKLA